MKKILFSCLFSLSVMASTFAGTLSFLPANACDASKECASTNPKGCKVTSCHYGSTETGHQTVTCNYEKCGSGGDEMYIALESSGVQ